jgi:hypothetical protein
LIAAKTKCLDSYLNEINKIQTNPDLTSWISTMLNWPSLWILKARKVYG